jgi:hypothetical protein
MLTEDFSQPEKNVADNKTNGIKKYVFISLFILLNCVLYRNLKLAI